MKSFNAHWGVRRRRHAPLGSGSKQRSTLFFVSYCILLKYTLSSVKNEAPRCDPHRAALHSTFAGQRLEVMQGFDMASPRSSRLAGIFNNAKAQDALYSRPASARASLSSRPQSAHMHMNMNPPPAMHMRNSAMKGGTPRGMHNVSPRDINEMSSNVTEWLIRQSAIREMLGSAREHVVTPVAKRRPLRNDQPTLVPAPSGRSPREMPHQRVWREAAERQAKMRFLMQEREAQARAREQEAHAAAMVAMNVKHDLPAELKAKMVYAQRKLQEWFLEENKRFRKVFRTMDDDHNGWVDRKELRVLPMLTNLVHYLPPPVLEGLIDLMDLDGDGRILYNEFVRVIMADDVFNI
jgi:hypothetical protein